ncbi:MAG: 3-phosphoglycerate dehydrogenase family protein [Blastocatellia bacterium]
MKILIADPFEQSGLDALIELGCRTSYQPDLRDESLTSVIVESGAEVLVVRSTRVTEEMLEAGVSRGRLSLVVRAGAGYNTIDVAAASARGIFVANCPGKNSIAVAELAFGLMLSLDRQIPDNVADLRAGVWKKKTYSEARGLHGRTLGLIGLGQIGQEMIVRAHSFGMRVLGWSRRLTPERAAAMGIGYRQTILEVAHEADVLSLHLALTPETRGLINRSVFETMRPGSFVLNTSRAEIIDQAALAEAIREKGLRAGLDVFAEEPATATGEFRDGIVSLPGVYGTHHIGASTDQAQEAIAAETVRIIGTYFETGKVLHAVNLARQSAATHLLVIRHKDRPGVLAHVLNQVKAADLNVQQMENLLFDGGEAALARIELNGTLEPEQMARIREGNPDILEASLLRL